MGYPYAYIDYLIHFHGDRDYFECHEVLEDYWKHTDKNNRESIWIGLIQVAVSFYHYRRQNLNGAFKLMNKALKNIELNKMELKMLGIDSQSLVDQLDHVQTSIKKHEPYQSINLPIFDKNLVTICKYICESKNLSWCSTSDLKNTQLIHRHKLRDRTDIKKKEQKH